MKKDAELSQWLVWKDMAVPLCAGLAPSHHRRWAVRLAAPGPDEPQGWYEDFITRWRAYLETLARPRGSRPTAEVPLLHAARIRPRLLLEATAEAPTVEDFATPVVGAAAGSGTTVCTEVDVMPAAKRPRRPAAALAAGRAPARKRSAPPSSAGATPAPRRQRTLTTWIGRRVEDSDTMPAEEVLHQPLPRQHGRAAESPPT